MRIIPSQEELQRWSGYIYGVPSLLEIVAVMESVEEAIEESNVWRISRSNMLRGFQIVNTSTHAEILARKKNTRAPRT
jgi:uncharacterized membrane protein